MATPTQTYKKRVRAHSTLSVQALTVALVVADLRYEARLHSHEPLPLKLADLARECHMVRASAARYLAECVDAGWIVAKPVHRDGRQQASEFTLADPTGTGVRPVVKRRRSPMTQADRARLAARTESTPVDAETADTESTPVDAETANTESTGMTESVTGLDTVVRSNNKPEAAPPPSGAGLRQQDNPLTWRCPTCHAPIGRRCHTPNSRPHWERLALAGQQNTTRAAPTIEELEAAVAAAAGNPGL